MNIAYNAALQAAATAALAAAGYRATRDAHHYRVIQSLRETVGTEATVVATFGLVSDADAEAMRVLAVAVRDEVIAWLTRHQASLVPR